MLRNVAQIYLTLVYDTLNTRFYFRVAHKKTNTRVARVANSNVSDLSSILYHFKAHINVHFTLKVKLTFLVANLLTIVNAKS